MLFYNKVCDPKQLTCRGQLGVSIYISTELSTLIEDLISEIRKLGILCVMFFQMPINPLFRELPFVYKQRMMSYWEPNIP